MAPTQQPKPERTILSDEPASDDKFGQHTRIANAIYNLVCGPTPEGRCIALTGPWGSGKSTVIRQLRRIIDEYRSETRPDIQVFLFDAWTFQGDPLRRCFLERLIRFATGLISVSKTPPANREGSIVQAWTDQLDTITGRREITKATAKKPLSMMAVWIAITLLICLPMGSALLGRYDATKQSFWLTPFGLCGLVLMSTPGALLLYKTFRRELPQMASAFVRDLHQDTETTTVRTREASSTDFQDLFAEIAKTVLASSGRRLVIVIDNLDRVEATHAVAMWTTMRNLFEFSGDDNRGEWNKRVWLLVPFDRSALRKLWREEDRDSHLSESFLNKTFQVFFDLPPLLFTKVREYFEEQMRLALPPDQVETHFDDVYRIFRRLGPPTPSPRDVKVFLNRLHSKWLLWAIVENADNRVLLPCLAAHQLKADEIAAKPEILLEDNFLDVSV